MANQTMMMSPVVQILWKLRVISKRARNTPDLVAQFFKEQGCYEDYCDEQSNNGHHHEPIPADKNERKAGSHYIIYKMYINGYLYFADR